MRRQNCISYCRTTIFKIVNSLLPPAAMHSCHLPLAMARAPLHLMPLISNNNSSPDLIGLITGPSTLCSSCSQLLQCFLLNGAGANCSRSLMLNLHISNQSIISTTSPPFGPNLSSMTVVAPPNKKSQPWRLLLTVRSWTLDKERLKIFDE